MTETIQERAEAVCFQSGHDFSGPLKDECLRCRRVFSQKIESCAACTDPVPGAVHRMGPECALCPRMPIRVLQCAHCGQTFREDDIHVCVYPKGHRLISPAEQDYIRMAATVLLRGPTTPSGHHYSDLLTAARAVVGPDL